MTVNNLIKGALFTALVVTSSIAFGQDQQMQQRTPEQKAQRQTMWMQKNLGITQDQSDKVYTILLSATRDADNVKMEPGGREKKEAKQDIKAETATQLQAVLSPDQYQKFMQHMQEMKQQMQQRKAAMQQGGN